MVIAKISYFYIWLITIKLLKIRFYGESLNAVITLIAVLIVWVVLV